MARDEAHQVHERLLVLWTKPRQQGRKQKHLSNRQVKPEKKKSLSTGGERKLCSE